MQYRVNKADEPAGENRCVREFCVICGVYKLVLSIWTINFLWPGHLLSGKRWSHNDAKFVSLNQAALNDGPLERIVTAWNPSGFQKVVSICFSFVIVTFRQSGTFRQWSSTGDSERPHDTTNSHLCYNVMPLAVFLNSQRRSASCNIYRCQHVSGRLWGYEPSAKLSEQTQFTTNATNQFQEKAPTSRRSGALTRMDHFCGYLKCNCPFGIERVLRVTSQVETPRFRCGPSWFIETRSRERRQPPHRRCESINPRRSFGRSTSIWSQKMQFQVVDIMLFPLSCWPGSGRWIPCGKV
jgi:hypothetical protein